MKKQREHVRSIAKAVARSAASLACAKEKLAELRAGKA